MKKTTMVTPLAINLAKVLFVLYQYEDEKGVQTSKGLASKQVKGCKEQQYMVATAVAKEVVAKIAQAKGGKAKDSAIAFLKDFPTNIGKIEGIDIPSEVKANGVNPFILKKYAERLITAVKAGDIELSKEIVQELEAEAASKE